MTNEEIEKKSEEYAEKNKPSDALCSMGEIIGNAREYDGLKQGFIAGAKWGIEHAIEWHDLRKNPNNLPKEDDKFLYKFEILVPIDNCNLTEFCIIDGNKYIAKIASWNKDFNIFFTLEGKNYLRNNVIAWCELPTYKE